MQDNTCYFSYSLIFQKAEIQTKQQVKQYLKTTFQHCFKWTHSTYGM